MHPNTAYVHQQWIIAHERIVVIVGCPLIASECHWKTARRCFALTLIVWRVMAARGGVSSALLMSDVIAHCHHD